MTRHFGKKMSQLAAAAIVSAIFLTACAEQGGTATNNGAASEGVPYGASKKEYQQALAGMEEVVLNAQSPAPKGAPGGRKTEAYLDAITEWSGGKIAFDVVYSSAVAPPQEVDEALSDGRLDLGSVVTAFTPDRYPANAALYNVSFLSRSTPFVGLLQTHAWMLDVAYQTPQIFDEFERNGVTVIIPAFVSGATGLLCGEPRRSLNQMRGAVTSAANRATAAQVSALGMSPTEIPITELYTSLQRGVIDCATSSLLLGNLFGYIPVAPHATFDPAVGFGYGPGALAMSTQQWEQLPLVARQLFFDRIDVFLKTGIKATLQSMAEALTKISDAGGEVKPLSDSARRALKNANSKLLQTVRNDPALDDGDAFVDAAQSSSKKWLHVITDELGYNDISYRRFLDWYTPQKVDLEPFIDRLFKDILLPHRPS